MQPCISTRMTRTLARSSRLCGIAPAFLRFLLRPAQAFHAGPHQLFSAQVLPVICKRFPQHGLQPLSQGVGVMTASAVLWVSGFSTGGGGAGASEESIRALGFGYGVSVLAAWTLMLICVSFYKISRESHAENLRLLGEREAAAGGPGPG